MAIRMLLMINPQEGRDNADCCARNIRIFYLLVDKEVTSINFPFSP